MAYVKNTWVDQAGQIRYEQTTDEDDLVILTPNYELITEIGTPVNATNMNHIEDGIAGCYNDLVNKSGDTMTGGLRIDTAFSDNGIILKNTSDNTSSSPSTDQLRSFRAVNNDDTILGDVRFLHNTNGSTSTQLYSRNYATGSLKQAFLSIDVSASGVASCTFPNTTCCDGAFVSSAKDLSSIKTTGTYTIDLQSYLPSGGAIYEVWLTGSNFTSGNTYSIYKLYTDIMNAQLPVNDTGANYSWITHTGTNSREGCFLIKVPVRRYIYEIIEAANLSNRFVPLTALGYRRIGTNS